MAKKIWQSFIQGTNGNVIPNALVSVDVAGGGTAVLYADAAGTIPKDNPFNASSQGYVFFYADEGEYDITASSGSFSFEFPRVELGAPDKVSFLGSFSTLGQLESAHPSAVTGSLAQVDADSNSDATLYTFDADQGWIAVGTGGGGGLTWEAIKSITVGAGGDYADIETAMSAITTTYAGNLLFVTLNSEMSAASALLVSFPTYGYVQFGLNNQNIGDNIVTIKGGSQFCALSGSGSISAAGITIIGMAANFSGAAPTVDVSTLVNFRESLVSGITPTFTTSNGSGLNFTGTNLFNSGINTGCQVGQNGGTLTLGSTTVTDGLTNAFTVNGGGAFSVASVDISSGTVGTVYNLNKGHIFAGAVTGSYTNLTNSPGAANGAIYGP